MLLKVLFFLAGLLTYHFALFDMGWYIEIPTLVALGTILGYLVKMEGKQ